MIYPEIYYMIAEMRFHKRSTDLRHYIFPTTLYCFPNSHIGNLGKGKKPLLIVGQFSALKIRENSQ